MAGRTPAKTPARHIPIPADLDKLFDWTVSVPYFHRRNGTLVADTYGPYQGVKQAVDVLTIFCQRWFDVGIPPPCLEPSATADGPDGPVTVRLSEIYRRAWGPRPLILAAAEDDD